MPEETIITNRTERANSFEFGKAGSRFKVYFDSEAGCKAMVDACKAIADHKAQVFGEEPVGE